jgi:hypothetical protein
MSWNRCEPCHGRSVAVLRDGRRCPSHAAEAVDRLVQLAEEATEDGADVVTAVVSLPIIEADDGELELEAGDWETELVAGRLLLKRYPQFLTALAAPDERSEQEH